MVSASKAPSIHRLKVTLKGSKPSIWRRVEVPSHFHLGQLHAVLQAAFGWENEHLHQFFDRATQTFYEAVSDMYESATDAQDESKATLGRAMPRAKAKLTYEYDFGDGWQHEIVVEAIEAPEPEVQYPRCLAGKCACPPEDCGGIYGYYELLAALANPKHPNHEDMLEWHPNPIDPLHFDLEAANKALRACFRLKKAKPAKG